MYLFMHFFFKISQPSKYSHLNIKSPLLSNSGFLPNSIKLLKFNKYKEQFTLKTLSFQLNTKPHNKLNKEIVDFKKLKGRPVMPRITKCFHHKNGKNINSNKRCKTHTQYQKQNKCCKIIAYLLACTPYIKKNWQPVGKAITIYISFFSLQQKQKGIISFSNRMTVTSLLQ